MRGGRQVSNSDRVIMLNKAPIVISAICSWPMDKSGSPQAGSVFLDVFRMSCAARTASASDLHEIPIKFRYGLVSVASWYRCFGTIERRRQARNPTQSDVDAQYCSYATFQR